MEADAIRAIGVTEVAHYRWRQEFGALNSDQVRKLKDLKAENARLRRTASDLTLDKMILAEAARGNFQARAGYACLDRRGCARVAGTDCGPIRLPFLNPTPDQQAGLSALMEACEPPVLERA